MSRERPRGENEDVGPWRVRDCRHKETHQSESGVPPQQFSLTPVPMSVREAPHQLIADLHETLFVKFPPLCVCSGKAAPAIRKRNIIDGTQAKKLILLGGAYNLPTHITVISSNQFRMSISNDINIFSGTRQLDEVTQTDAARAPVAECTAPPTTPRPLLQHQ